MLTSTITQKGQVTIPAQLRQKLDVHPGDSIEFHCKNNKIFLVKRKNDITEAFGMLKSNRSVSLKDMDEAIKKGATRDNH